MRVIKDREDVVLRAAAKREVIIGAGGSLEHAPAVVAAVDDWHIDFLARALSDVGDPLDAGDAVEAEAPRIAEAVRKNLVRAGRRAKEGIGRWRRIRAGCADIYPQNFPEEHVDVLRIARRIV